MTLSTRTVERIIDRISFADDCWLWTGAKNLSNKGGYGHFCARVNGKVETYNTHRVMYELLRGEIADGLEIDHLCRVRHCMNPDHMETVSHQVNMSRRLY